MSKEKVSYTKTQFKKEFARLIEKTSIPNTFSQEESVKVLKKLHDFVQPYIPAKLFRFRKDHGGRFYFYVANQIIGSSFSIV